MSTQAQNPSVDFTTKQELSASESAQVIKTLNPKHPALNRLHAELKNAGGTAAITAYDRMHHRHSRS